MEFPTKVEREPNVIKRLLIVSHPKVGKTHALTKLPGNYILNYDDSLAHFGAEGVNVVEFAHKLKKNPISVTHMIAKKLQQMKKEGQGYDYITLDTITELENLCEPYAKAVYQRTPQGENFRGNLLSDLEYGAGYLKLRDALISVIDQFWSLPNKCLIMTGHLRETSIRTRGTTVSAVDIGLTGKTKQIISQRCDAIGTLYRSTEDNNVNILSFITRTDDLVTGARASHVSNREFEISRMNGDQLLTNWEEVFPEIKQS